MAPVVAAHSVCNGTLSACDLIRGRPRFQLGEVNRAIEIVRQKNVCARHAWSVEIGAGRRRMTVRPPRRPCRITVPNAATLSHRTHARGSFSHVQIARITVRKPTNDATRRWLCSKKMPPTHFENGKENMF